LDFGGEAMSFRRRLLVLFSITVFISVAIVTLIVSAMARRAFDRASDERTAALVAQFRREFTRRGQELGRRIQAIASTPQATQMVVAGSQASPDYGIFLDDAHLIAEAQRLDFLEFTDDRGTIISSAQWPAKFGYKEPLAIPNAPQNDAFLKEEEIPNGRALGLFAIRTRAASDRKIYVIGGVRLDKAFLSTLELPSGMRVMLYENLQPSAQNFLPVNLISAGETIQNAHQLAGFIQSVARTPSETGTVIHWNSGEDETINAFPLTGDKNQLLAILLVGSSRRAYADLRSQIRTAALLASGAGLLLAIVLSSWAAARVTKPVEDLARAAHELAAGNWNATVAATSPDEIGELAESFNRMTHDLLDQRERLVQTERVAAWRELARRLAHELKNPLFPLQLTVENLLRAREQGQQQFDETFHESAATLLSEISNLKTIIARFSDFSKMPQPQFQPVQLSDLIQDLTKLHQAQFAKSNIMCRLEFAENLPSIAADPDLLHRALSNLVLNAIEAMPEGGTLIVRTRHESNSASIEISDTGKGFSAEERSRLFTPYYTSKVQGTGLGLAIVQSIISDHGGRISVRSEQDRGTTFIIDLPANRDTLSAAHRPRAPGFGLQGSGSA
jgi:two-component system nitrogen regulation sensor histidine kinase NtrY